MANQNCPFCGAFLPRPRLGAPFRCGRCRTEFENPIRADETDLAPEDRARATKAARLADAFTAELRKVDQTVDAAAVVAVASRASDAVWADVADLNGIRPPSEKTIGAALGLLAYAALDRAAAS